MDAENKINLFIFSPEAHPILSKAKKTEPQIVYKNEMLLLQNKFYKMKRDYIISFVLSTLLLWFICYVFNTTAILGKFVVAKAFISPWLTFTTVMKYFHLGMGITTWAAYLLSAVLLIFLWISLYIFISSLLRAIALKTRK